MSAVPRHRQVLGRMLRWKQGTMEQSLRPQALKHTQNEIAALEHALDVTAFAKKVAQVEVPPECDEIADTLEGLVFEARVLMDYPPTEEGTT